MSLGVLNNLSAMYAENSLNNTTNSLNTVLQQLSSGSKINSGADDAAGLSLVDGLQANSQALAQSQTNAQEGVGLLQVADGALSQVTSLLNRAVTLATEASNGTLNSSQDSAANQEYQSILSEVSNIGSTTTYNGNAVFNSNTNIYTGDSTAQGASVDALNIRTLSSSNVGDTDGTMNYTSASSGSSVFVDLSNGGVNAAVTDSLGASTATTTIAVNYLTKGANGTATSATANITVGAGTAYANTTTGLISAVNGSGLGLTATFGTAAQAGATSTSASGAANASGGGSTDTGIIISGAGVGTGTNGAGAVGTLTVGGTTDTLGGTLAITGSNGSVHTVTLGTANSTDTLANLANTINTANYGVTASVNSSVVDGNAVGTVLTFTSADSAVTVAGTSVTDTSTAATAPASSVVAVPTGAMTAGSTMATINASAANQQLGGTLTLFGAGLTGVSALNTITGINSSAGVITLGVVGATDTLANLANTINNNQTIASGTAGHVVATLNTAGTALVITNQSQTGTVTTGYTDLVSGTTVLNTAATDSLTGTPTLAGAASSNVIGTLTGLTGSSTYTAGTLNIGSNAGITLGTATGTSKTDTLADIAATINAGKYGVTASLNTAGTVLSFSSANAADTFSVSGATVTATKGSIVASTNVANQSQIGTVSFTATGTVAGDLLTNATTLQVGSTTFTASSETLAAFATSINSANDGYTATATVGTGTGANASETLTLVSTSAATQRLAVSSTLTNATHASTGVATTDSPSTGSSAYYGVGISGSITDTTTSGGILNTGIVSNSTGAGGVATISYSDSTGASLSSTDLSNQADSQAALTSLNAAITDVAAQDGYVGAQINTLNAVSSVLSTQQENVTSAQNAVQATDYASATSNMSKYEILSQTGISALAQANSMSQEVTKLLQ
jgi:flagellin